MFQSAVFPESCDNVVPVIYDAASVVIKYIEAAISSGLVNTVFGYFLSVKNYIICYCKDILLAFAIFYNSYKRGGVATHPGQIALHVIWSNTTSRATALVKPTKPCFVDAYAEW